MKKVILVRHGNCHEATGQLDDEGRAQIEILVEILRAHLNGRSVRMLSSTAARAVQSAEIIARRLAVEFERNESLKYGLDDDLQKVWDLIKDDGHEVAVLVAHKETAEFFPEFLRRKYLPDLPSFDGRGRVQTGMAVVIDPEASTVDLL